MSTLLRRLRISSQPPPPSRRAQLKEGPECQRTKIGPASIHLKDEITRLYWSAAENELLNVVSALHAWQEDEATWSTTLPDEEDHLIHGYDTFLDQVNHDSRHSSWRNAAERAKQLEPQMRQQQQKKKNKKSKKGDLDGPPSYDEALENRAWDFHAEAKSQQIKTSIRESLLHLEPESLERRRARMLLQSSQFLDIDRIIEHRDLDGKKAATTRQSTAHLEAPTTDAAGMPIFTPKRCKACHNPIRGPAFSHTGDPTGHVCQSCYWANHYGDGNFTKSHKTDGLHDAMTVERAHEICKCPEVPKRDRNGRLLPLFPLQDDPHIRGGRGKVQCALYELADLTAEAKFNSTKLLAEKHITLAREKLSDQVSSTEIDEYGPRRRTSRVHPMWPEDTSMYTTSELQTGDEKPMKVAEYIMSKPPKNPDRDCPMAIRFGPIIIENGIASTMRGVLITTRDPPAISPLANSAANKSRSLIISGGGKRHLYSEDRPCKPRRIKLVMKQVVGGAFASFFDLATEGHIIDKVIQASRSSSSWGLDQDENFQEALAKLRDHLGPRVNTFISSLVDRLLAPNVQLSWHKKTNTCRHFCDQLVDQRLFGPLFSLTAPLEKTQNPSALYLMSFVCRPGAFIAERPKSRFDVPNGYVEEYLLRMRSGRHEDADLIDSMRAYWHEWGALDIPLVFQGVFPWDCTEAYERYPMTCGECNISKHVWAFPFDSWSTVSHHLSRGRHLYESRSDKRPLMTDRSWFQNRMTVLLAQDVLLKGAVAMARCGSFREATLWLHAQNDERHDRLKMGGIHRAQPFSHFFERGAHHQFFIANWAGLRQDLRIAAYEKLREARALQSDIREEKVDSNRGGGCGGFFACGTTGTGHGCAGGGCSGQRHDTCGTGCVSSCSSSGGGGGGGGCGGGGCGGGGCGGGGCGG